MLVPTPRRRPIEYAMIHDAQPDGPPIGRFADQQIASAIIDRFGRRFCYVGVAQRLPEGRYDDDALKPGEFIVEPGLVYRLA